LALVCTPKKSLFHCHHFINYWPWLLTLIMNSSYSDANHHQQRQPRSDANTTRLNNHQRTGSPLLAQESENFGSIQTGIRNWRLSSCGSKAARRGSFIGTGSNERRTVFLSLGTIPTVSPDWWDKWRMSWINKSTANLWLINQTLLLIPARSTRCRRMVTPRRTIKFKELCAVAYFEALVTNFKVMDPLKYI